MLFCFSRWGTSWNGIHASLTSGGNGGALRQTSRWEHQKHAKSLGHFISIIILFFRFFSSKVVRMSSQRIAFCSLFLNLQDLHSVDIVVPEETSFIKVAVLGMVLVCLLMTMHHKLSRHLYITDSGWILYQRISRSALHCMILVSISSHHTCCFQDLKETHVVRDSAVWPPDNCQDFWSV